jgi:AcrR family transcriptional regulator
MTFWLMPHASPASEPNRARRAGPPARTQAERRGESDRRMLRALTRLISRHGVSGTSLADVGVAAGYSRGLPVERFGSKRAMIESLLESMDVWFRHSLVAKLDGKRGLAALVARIDAHLDGARRSRTATAALFSIYVESLCVMPELRPRVALVTDGWRQGIAGHLREGQSLGEVRKGIDCDRHAAVILGAMRGLLIQHLMDEASTELEHVRAAVLTLAHDVAQSSPPPEGKVPSAARSAFRRSRKRLRGRGRK